MFTFDDAFESVLQAAPILARYGWPATVFVVSDLADTGRPAEWPGLESTKLPLLERRAMSWEQLRTLAAAGWEVGSHTMSHPLLTTLTDSQIASELRGSLHRVAAMAGECRSLAYPYGRADDRVARLAAEAGYEAACTLTGAHPVDTTYLRPRLPIDERDVGLRLSLKISRIALAARRSPAAKAGAKLRRRRSWLPTGASDG